MNENQRRRILRDCIDDAQIGCEITAERLEQAGYPETAQGVANAFDRLRSELFLIHNANQ